MNNQIQLVLKSSTTELSLNDHELGIYLTPELDGLTGLPEIRTTSGVNAGYDGGWTSAQNYDARSITIRGVIANEDVATVEQLRRQLTTLAGQGKSEELTLDLVTQAGKAYTIQVRTIALEMSLQKVLTQQEFMLQLRADDPLIYDASETGHEALLQVAQATGGFTIDFELPLAITGSSEETVVNNEGLEQVPTITRMYGALHNPKIINQTTNQFMQLEADLGFAEGDWIEPSEVVSGKDITINGAPEGAPLSSVQINGNTSQQTYSGKNLYNVADMSTVSSGVTIDSEGWITVQHTATGSATYLDFRSNPLAVQASTNYAIITEVKNISGAGELNITSVPSNPQQFNSRLSYEFSALAAGEVKVDISTTKSNVTATYGLRSYCYFSGTQSGSVTFRISVISNTSVTPQTFTYEPYVGGIPAPNPDYPQAVQTVTGENILTISDGMNTQSYEVNLGKNLYDKDSADYNVYLGSESVAVNAQGNGWSIAIPVEAGQTYTFSKQFTTGQASDANYAFIGSAPAAGVAYIGGRQSLGTGTTFTATAPTGAKYLIIYYTWNATAAQKADAKATFQIEKGSQATSYAAYFTPIELCKIGDYQDSIYKSSGKWYVHKAVGKENWTSELSYQTYTSGGVLRFYRQMSPLAVNNSGRSADFKTQYFHFLASGDAVGGALLYNRQLQVMFSTDTSTTVEQFKTWLDSHPMSVYYPLATPTDTEITNEALIAQLEALAAATMYNPQTNITTLYADGNEQPTLDVSYFTDKNPDTRDELVIDSRLRTITLNGLDVYHLQAPGSEFLMLAPGENRLALQSDITGDNGYAQVSYKQGYLSI